MSNKKPFVLRIDVKKLRALEKWAEDEFRSTNGQIEYILDQALRKAGRWKLSRDPEEPGEKMKTRKTEDTEGTEGTEETEETLL